MHSCVLSGKPVPLQTGQQRFEAAIIPIYTIIYTPKVIEQTCRHRHVASQIDAQGNMRHLDRALPHSRERGCLLQERIQLCGLGHTGRQHEQHAVLHQQRRVVKVRLLRGRLGIPVAAVYGGRSLPCCGLGCCLQVGMPEAHARGDLMHQGVWCLNQEKEPLCVNSHRNSQQLRSTVYQSAHSSDAGCPGWWGVWLKIRECQVHVECWSMQARSPTGFSKQVCSSRCSSFLGAFPVAVFICWAVGFS